MCTLNSSNQSSNKEYSVGRGLRQFSRILSLVLLVLVFTAVSCSDSSQSVNPDIDVPENGILIVQTVTTGGDPNPEGYVIAVQGAGTREMEANGSTQFGDLEAGTYQIQLNEIAGHCELSGENPVSIEVIAGDTVTAIFEVSCRAILRSQIVFLSNMGTGVGLYKMHHDGSNAERIASYTVGDVWRPAISPDGTKIAFVSAGGGFNTQQVWVVDADGSNTLNLTQNANMHSEHPTWSPDGSQIAFHAYEPGGLGDIYIMNADGSGVTNVTNSSIGDWWPSWSSDGETIAFHSTEPGIPPYISTIKTDGSGRAELFRDESVFFRNPSWSPDGETIAFQSNLESAVSWEIMIADADGSNPRSVTNLAESGIHHRFPTWSPDGSQIAFDSNRDGGNGGNYDIFVVSIDGTGLTNITNDESFTAIFPTWSPVE